MDVCTWSSALLALALWSAAGCSAAECPPGGGDRFWDGCNWCFCRGDEVVGCTNMACTVVPHRFDSSRATIGPPDREGILAYRPGRSRVVDPSGWPCQIGSSWLEDGGCVRCICSNKMIKCRDSGLCLNGELVSEEQLFPAEAQLIRRRRETDADGPSDTTGSPAAAEPSVAEAESRLAETTAAATSAATSATTATAWSATPTATPTAAPTAIPSVEGATPSPPPDAAPAAAAAASPEASNGTQSTLVPPAATTAQATVVKDRTCKTGSTWEEECNTCWCLDNIRAACTTNSCEAPPALPLAPGSAPATAAPALPLAPGSAPVATAPAPSSSTAPAVTASGPPSVPEASSAAPTEEARMSETTTATPASSTTGSRRKRRFAMPLALHISRHRVTA